MSDKVETAHVEVTKDTDDETVTEVSDAIKEPDGTLHEQSQTTTEPDEDEAEDTPD